MPKRDRHSHEPRSTTPEAAEEIARFAALLRADDDRKAAAVRAGKAKAKAERDAVAAAAAEAVRAEGVRTEHRDAVAALKEARRAGRGIAEAEARWKAASAAVLEIETGERPSWAPTPVEAEREPEAEAEAEAEAEQPVASDAVVDAVVSDGADDQARPSEPVI